VNPQQNNEDSTNERKPLAAGDYAIAGLLAAILVVVTAQVLWRYALNSSLVWTEELAKYLFTWMTFVGAVLAIKEGTHIRVRVLADRLPPTACRWLEVSLYLLMVLFLGFLVVVGFQLVLKTAGTRTPAMGLPLNWVFYAALPVPALAGVYYAFRRAVAAARKAGAREDRSEDR
jgi:TRAP-type C4-dicarboxylate transport system permease small subunit